MLKFISFGSGSSGNSLLLCTSTDCLLIDSGLGIRQIKKHFRDYGLSLSEIKHILVTHDHADHVKSVGSLSSDYHLPVYATKEVHKGIYKNYCVPRKVPVDLQRTIEKGKTYEIGEFQVTPFNVPHDSTDNVGYRIVCQRVVFCLITDAGEVTDEMKLHISGADYLVMEANHDEEMVRRGPYPAHLKRRILSPVGHLSNSACGEALAQNMTERLRRVWLCHLSEENNHPELARKTVEAILAGYGILVGKDLQLDVLKRTVPSGFYELTNDDDKSDDDADKRDI